MKSAIHFLKCLSETARCSHCDKHLRKGERAMSISRKDEYYKGNVWIHIGCINGFIKDIKKELKITLFNRMKK